MGRRKRTTRKNNVQHVLPQINLSPDVVDDVNELIRIPTPPRVVIEDHSSDEADNHTPFTLEAPLLSEEADSGNESATSSQIQKRKTNNTGKDDENHMQKKTRYISTINNMQTMQNQMFTILQDVQKKVNEMYIDWKAAGFGGNHVGNDMKWIDDAISQAIYTTTEKIKYPDDERIMQVCYDALLNANKEEFQNKIKNGGWKRFFYKNVRSLAQRFSRQARSNIVQRVKDAIHDEFTDLVKPKTENRQVTREEERKFKDANITRECYMKLRKPIDSNNPSYTYLNLIIDNAFPDSNTEKNSIAFGMAVALNYLDPSKGIKLVQSEVVERMNYFLEKMKVSDREGY